MRKINKLVGHVDRDVLFTQGVKRIIDEHARCPTNYRDYELDAMLRKEQALASFSQKRSRSFSAHIADVLNVFVWNTSLDKLDTLRRSTFLREHRLS